MISNHKRVLIQTRIMQKSSNLNSNYVKISHYNQIYLIRLIYLNDFELKFKQLDSNYTLDK